MKYLKKDDNVIRVNDGTVLEGYSEATQSEYVAQMSTSEDWPAVKANLEAEGEVFPDEDPIEAVISEAEDSLKEAAE